MGQRLLAVVCGGNRGRVYLEPKDEMERTAAMADPEWLPEIPMAENPRWFSPPDYGLPKYSNIFTHRQLTTLTTFSDLIIKARDQAIADAKASGFPDDGKALNDLGKQATAYGDAVAVYLAFALSKQADLGNSLCRWEPAAQCPRQLFGRQAIPMVWDFAEGNPLGESSGSWIVFIRGIVKAFSKTFEHSPNSAGFSKQEDACRQEMSKAKIVSTDPPYYDNIGYADLSDFFYIWLRRSLKFLFPALFATLTSPKNEELVATPYRHGGRDKADKFFLDNMTEAMRRIAENAHPAFPVAIYYAFKQTERLKDIGIASTGWETFIAAVMSAGFTISGTWPIRTENKSRMVGQDTNALASSIILACRKSSADAGMTTRRDFQNRLRAELPEALSYLQKGNIAPVDLAQSAIGPGMAIFSGYSKVIEADGTAMTVRTALALINEVLDEILAEQEGDLEPDSRWAIAWFEQYGTGEGPFGVAETLCKAKNTSIQGLTDAGLVRSKSGRVNLLRLDEMISDWDPNADKRLTIWEATHYLIRALEEEGELAAANLLKKMGGVSEQAKDLSYRLYLTCERKGWAEPARSYNALVVAWPELTRLAADIKEVGIMRNRELFE